MVSSSRALGIMGKVPVPGAVKTRLTPPLTASQAALLYRAFLRDSILIGLALRSCSVDVVYPPDIDARLLAELCPRGVGLLTQVGRGLGQALRGAFHHQWSLGRREVVLICSDAPTLPADYVEAAFQALERDACDVVLGPADDGGYYLIGLRDDHPELFEDVSWSSSQVMRQTLQRATEANLRVTHLPAWYDVDDEAGLARLIDDLGHDGRLTASATRAALQTLRRAGAALPLSPLPWPVQRSQRHFATRWRNLDIDTVMIHTGTTIDYGYFSVPDAVWIVPVTRDGDIVLVRQYRHPVRDWCLEIPAGTLGDEAMETAVERELREEVGGHAASMRFMGAFYSSSAHLTLRGNVFLALDVELADPDYEDTELMSPLRVPAELAFDMARRGEINEGQSALAVLFCEQAIREHVKR
jgi:rSAM/selenodomain-associated transferase 1